MKSARQVATEAVLRVDRGGYSQLTLDAALRKTKLSPRDAAFATALFYGTLERRLTLEHCIVPYARHPLSDTVMAILETAFYQILYMESVPRHAAVDEAVNLAKTMGQNKASGMVNGILRNFLRADCVIPPVKGSPAAKLAVEFSCHEEIVECFLAWYGTEKTRSILDASLGQAPLYLRTNTLRTDTQTLLIHLEAHGCTAKGVHLDGNCIEISGDPVHTVSHKRGFFHVQDLCSQQAALLVGAKPGERVLDLCAAPGSKSFILAQEMQNTGTLLACDVSAGRLPLIDEGAKRLGITMLTTRENDGSIYDPALGSFQRILCDVPCSGLGVLRRKPEIKYRGRDAFADLPALQYKILETAANYLEVDGTLVYSTCTINPHENEEIVEHFLETHPDFAPCPFDGENWYRVQLPAKTGGDGFFLSKLRRVK